MIRRLSVQDVSAMRERGQPMLLIDVREADEYALTHIEGAVLIQMSEFAVRVAEIQPEANEPVVLMCHHGVRSLRCGMFLAQSGVDGVANMDGGIDAWSREIDPTIRTY